MTEKVEGIVLVFEPSREYLNDHQYREVECKHIRRLRFATGQRPIPAWVNAGEVDTKLGEHVEDTPKVAVADGGVTPDSFGTRETDEEECWCDDH
jgi:hypothetical protein